MKKKNKPMEQPTAPIEQPSTFTFTPSITYAGGYRIGSRNNRDGYFFSFERKPNWFHRTMTRVCLGWEWIDANKN